MNSKGVWTLSFLDQIYKKSDSVVFRKIGDECILVPIRQDVGDLDSIYTLNETAAMIWELIDGKTTVGEIKERLLLEYDVTASQAEEDLLEHLKQLETLKAISHGGSDALP
jgi:hypothetical protein